MVEFLLFLLVGFLAQLIDGALGMAYGVSSNSFLLSLGVTPALASASVHFAEMFTTAVSGISHFKVGNVDRNLFKKLVIPGVLGGILGAYILTSISTAVIKPLVSLYLLVMGARILYLAFRKVAPQERTGKWLIPLGAIGGLMDAIGGGGWGPVVTTTLVASGKVPHKAIGSVNAAEFFVTVAESVVFIFTLGRDLWAHWQIIVGLLLGGMIAAPLAAHVCRRLPTRVLMGIVGVLIMFLSLRTLYLTWF